jgi:hypothetical protein
MRDLCSLYPYFLKNKCVAEILKRNWVSPKYSLYYPDVQWRSSIMHRAVNTQEGRLEFLDLLKAKWFATDRDCLRLSPQTPPLTQEMELVGNSGKMEVQFGFNGADQLDLKVKVPEPILDRYRCKFVFHVAFEDLQLALPPEHKIEMDLHQPAVAGTKSGGAVIFHTELATKQLLNGRKGAVRLCVSPVLSRYLENGTTKDITEDHYWAMPPLLQMQSA